MSDAHARGEGAESEAVGNAPGKVTGRTRRRGGRESAAHAPGGKPAERACAVVPPEGGEAHSFSVGAGRGPAGAEPARQQPIGERALQRGTRGATHTGRG